ncbi:hypothetical protein OROMI_023308 [Orobanche minor]
MAQTTNLRLNGGVFRVFGILFVLSLVQKDDAYEFKVGGSMGSWAVPKDHNVALYNQWAEHNRFRIGDKLLFVYAAGEDSVLHVTEDDYTRCNTGAPLEKFTDGRTVIEFNQSGPHYFISGVVDKCHRNEKLVVVVMADRSKNNNTNGTAETPSPSPSPQVPPSSDKFSPPSPAPAGEGSPSPPQNPMTPAPSEEYTPPKNGAISIGCSVVGIIVACFFGSSLVLGM